MVLTGRQEEAAALVAADLLTDEEIARRAGVTRKALWKWRQRDDFALRVQQLREEFRAAVRARGIAVLENRVARLNATRDALLRVVAERAEAHAGEAPGSGTGYLVRQVKLVKLYDATAAADGEDDVVEELEPQPHGGALRRRRLRADVVESLKQSVEVVEYALDAALVKALNEVERQAAIELGQWQEKAETTHVGQVTIRTITAVQPVLPAASDDDGG